MEKLMRREAVQEAVGLGRAMIYAMMARGEFPKPIRTGRRRVMWKASDVEAFIESRPVVGEAE